MDYALYTMHYARGRLKMGLATMASGDCSAWDENYFQILPRAI